MELTYSEEKKVEEEDDQKFQNMELKKELDKIK